MPIVIGLIIIAFLIQSLILPKETDKVIKELNGETDKISRL